jgi:hypothetical protein
MTHNHDLKWSNIERVIYCNLPHCGFSIAAIDVIKIVQAHFAAQEKTWTTEPPTAPGWYQARYRDGTVAFVEVWENLPGKFVAETTGASGIVSLHVFTHWLGPIPLASLPKEGDE